MTTLRIALTDDEQLILNLLRDYFLKHEDIEVSLLAASGEELLKKLETQTHIPNLFVLDLRMPELDGADTARELKRRYPESRIVVISSFYQKSLIGYMLRNGIDAFLPKGINPDELYRILKIVHEKGHFFTREQVSVMRSQITSKVPKPQFEAESLSKREIEVLQAICRQLTAKEISEQLFISRSTVEGHKNNLLQKTGARNSAGLVIFAVQNQLFDPDELIF
ncbi:response regulator transcription factor [bacterium SCSIO 12741]|nr:response regulator transcription factor [bacterium SCSIO 12741]